MSEVFYIDRGKDRIMVEILDDGTLKTTTDPVSAANHQNAEQFLADTQGALGGKTDIKKRGSGASMIKKHTGSQERKAN